MFAPLQPVTEFAWACYGCGQNGGKRTHTEAAMGGAAAGDMMQEVGFELWLACCMGMAEARPADCVSHLCLGQIMHDTHQHDQCAHPTRA